MKNIKVNFPVHGKIEVHADMDMMKTILRNLLSNAIKFSYNDSEILVNAEIEGDKVIVSVKDTGKGMSEEDQKKLLNTETHFSKYGTNNEEGSGLACYYVRILLLRMVGIYGLSLKREKVPLSSFR